MKWDSITALLVLHAISLSSIYSPHLLLGINFPVVPCGSMRVEHLFEFFRYYLLRVSRGDAQYPTSGFTCMHRLLYPPRVCTWSESRTLLLTSYECIDPALVPQVIPSCVRSTPYNYRRNAKGNIAIINPKLLETTRLRSALRLQRATMYNSISPSLSRQVRFAVVLSFRHDFSRYRKCYK